MEFDKNQKLKNISNKLGDSLVTDNKSKIFLENDPDFYIEQFWYGFKQSMVNFYNYVTMNYTHITEWSNKLNNYKKQKDYNNIETSIREFMAQYSYDLIKYSNETYHDEIFLKNIKRWNNISFNFNFNKNIKYVKLVILFMIYLEIKTNNYYELLENTNIETILDTNDYDIFIIYGLENEKTKILELIKKIPEYNLNENIKKLYPNLNITNNICVTKICNIFRKLYSL